MVLVLHGHVSNLHVFGLQLQSKFPVEANLTLKAFFRLPQLQARLAHLFRCDQRHCWSWLNLLLDDYHLGFGGARGCAHQL